MPRVTYGLVFRLSTPHEEMISDHILGKFCTLAYNAVASGKQWLDQITKP